MNVEGLVDITIPSSLETINRFSLGAVDTTSFNTSLIISEDSSINYVDSLAFSSPYGGYNYSYLGQLLRVKPTLGDTLLAKANASYPFDENITSDPNYVRYQYPTKIDYKLRKLDEYGFIEHHKFTDYLLEQEIDEETVTSIEEFLSNKDLTLEQVKTNEIVKAFMDEHKGSTVVFCPKTVDSRGRTRSQYYLAVYRKIFNIDFTLAGSSSSSGFTVYTETIE